RKTTSRHRHKPAVASGHPKPLASRQASARTGAKSGPEALRRILLGAITALVVARPLVLGGGPGLLLRPWADGCGLVVAFLWLITALGGAVWLVWSGQRTGSGGIIEWSFLAVVALVFASAAWSAAYQRPAWLIAWEWLALFLAFWLVRLLVRTPAENQ